MAVKYVAEVFEGRTSRIDRQWQRSFTRTWRVETDSPYDGAQTAREAVPVAIGNYYLVLDAGGATVEKDLQSFALEIAAAVESAADDGCSWLVTVNYGPYDAQTFGPNPIDHPLKISFGFAKYEKVVDKTVPDEDGNTEAIVNSAGDYFDPPPVKDDSRPLIKITRNEPTYDPLRAKEWKDAINQDAWNGFDPGTVKCGEIAAELAWSQECQFYYIVNYEFEIEPDGWALEVLDQGLRSYDTSTEKQVAIADEKGEPVTSPVLLDGDGQQLAGGADPVFLTFDVYNKRDFVDLKLDFQGAPGQAA